MSYTKNPVYIKNSADTTLDPSPGAKRVKAQYLSLVRGDVADIGKAPTSRVYTRDYSKGNQPYDTDPKGNADYVTPVLGPPLRL
jgi:hypothetical protein